MARKHKGAAEARPEAEIYPGEAADSGDYETEPTQTETESMDYQDHNDTDDAEDEGEALPTKVIKIGAMSLTVHLPFTEGHVCTAAEARALNQTRLENIRNACTAKAKAASEKNEDLEALLPDLIEYEKAYEFTIGHRTRIGSASRDPILVEERRLAREQLHRQLKARGYVLKDVPAEQKDAILQRYLDSGHFRAQAEANVKAREALLVEAEDILGGMELPPPAPAEVAEAAD